MRVLLGFDPGGADGFGWCVVEDRDELPLQIRDAGVVSNARTAMTSVQSVLRTDDQVLGAGIDAPMFWVAEGDRNADRVVRDASRLLGLPSPWGTVQAVNSLRGACLVQGIMIGILVRREWRDIPISEAHPKAYLWLAHLASRSKHHGAVFLESVVQLLAPEGFHALEHHRDAAIASLSAWAMRYHPEGWRDLYVDEPNAFSPLLPPLGYWMPGV